jgi:hypothetical protein
MKTNDPQKQNDALTASVWISSLNAIAGIWLLFAPFIVSHTHGAARVNDIVLGIVIGVFALIRAFIPGLRTAWLSWLNALFGIWLIVAPFALVYRGAGCDNDIVVGIIVLILGVWSAVASAQNQTIPMPRE